MNTSTKELRPRLAAEAAGARTLLHDQIENTVRWRTECKRAAAMLVLGHLPGLRTRVRRSHVIWNGIHAAPATVEFSATIGDRRAGRFASGCQMYVFSGWRLQGMPGPKP